jgi:hypothetical protein
MIVVADIDSRSFKNEEAKKPKEVQETGITI